MPDTVRNKAIVVGGGPAGLTVAIVLAAGGIETVLAGRRPGPSDNRTTALLAGSVTALETLGVWDLCAGQSAPLRTMRLVDDTGRIWRAPEVKFEADEIGLPAFGHNIENRHLVAALEQRARALPALRLIEDEVTRVAHGADGVTVTLSGTGELTDVRFAAGSVDGSEESLSDLGDLVVAAYRDAKGRADQLAAQTLGPLAGGLGGPGGSGV